MLNFRRLGSLVAATTVSALALTGTTVAVADENGDIVDIRVANFTDFHGRLEFAKGAGNKAKTPEKGDEMGAANVAGIINYLRGQNENLIVTTSGDNQGGSAFVSMINEKDQPTMDFLKAIGTHGSAVGNHEFDEGYSDLTGRILGETAVAHDNVTSADDSKWKDQIQLGANIFLAGTETREVNPYNIVEVDGVKVALIGTTSNFTKAKSNPANVDAVDIKDSADWINNEAKQLKADGKADVVIALIHDDAKERAPKLNAEYVDFLFGGDSHLSHVDAQAPVPYAQAWEYGKTVVDLDFKYNKTTGEIVGDPKFNFLDGSHLVELDIKPDPAVEEIVNEAKKSADVLGAEVVAVTAADFKRGSNPGEEPGSNRGTESTANNMIADAAVRSLSAYMDQDIDFGIMNAGGVRADIPAGEVTYKQAVTVQPFGNDISYAKVTGATLKEMLENQWRTEEAIAGGDRPRLDMGLSNNVAYTYNPEAPRGERILSITIDGKPVDPAKEYSFAASTFLLNGGDEFIDSKKVIGRLDVGLNDAQALIDYLNSAPEGEEITPRTGQKDVGVVLPKDGLKAGKNEIKLTSLSYSSEGEPKAENVTVKIGGVEATAAVNNEVTEADAKLGEQGRATVTIDIPAGVTGEQTLQITTDAGTDISMPVTVGEGKGAPAGGSSNEGSSNDGSSVEGSSVESASTSDIVLAITATVAVLGLIGLLASSGIKHIAADIIAQMPNVPMPKLPF